jgi:hypothetical protein
MACSTLRRSTATSLIFGFVTIASSGFLQAASPSSLSGRVLAPNGADPRAGVVVTLIEPKTETAYRSGPTDARGAFNISSAPAGSYALVVEAPEGAFLASDHLQLAPGVNRPLSLALKPQRAGEQPPAESTPPPQKKKNDIPTWAKWTIAGGIIVGGALAIDAVTSSSKEASSF